MSNHVEFGQTDGCEVVLMTAAEASVLLPTADEDEPVHGTHVLVIGDPRAGRFALEGDLADIRVIVRQMAVEVDL